MRCQGKNELVPNYVIIAVNVPLGQPRYFLGYRDCGRSTECVWTLDFWQALRADINEATVEALLLAELCPNRRLVVQSLGTT
jgi:hypothetical protein